MEVGCYHGHGQHGIGVGVAGVGLLLEDVEAASDCLGVEAEPDGVDGSIYNIA